MLSVVKLTRNGNATTMAIPRVMIDHLRWLPGEHVALQANENGTLTIIRIDIAQMVRAATAETAAASAASITA